MTSHQATLFVTHCCEGKNQVCGNPLELYTSRRVQRFGEWCSGAGVQWAIVSAKHGLFFPQQRHGPYNTAFTFFYGDCIVIEDGESLSEQQSQAHTERLVQMIDTRLKELGIRRVVFYLGGAFERVSPCYFLVVHRGLDKCTESHSSREDLRRCIEKAGRLRIAGGMYDVQSELDRLRSPAG